MGLKERVVLPVAKRWIAGPDLKSAIADAKVANARGMGVVANFLGEDIKDPAMADVQVGQYLKLQQAIADEKIEGFASIKLTQFGLSADEPGMRSRLESVAANAERLRQRLWIDMEGSSFTDLTIRTYLEAHEKHEGLGVAVQAYAKRSSSDLQSILRVGGKVRLVKGAYKESSDFIYADRREVRENYSKLMEALFQNGHGFAIATHDSSLVEKARRLAESSSADFHFEMLKGIRDELKDDLVKSGYRVYEYLPYGDSWYAYSKRRMSEHPGNFWLLLRSLV